MVYCERTMAAAGAAKNEEWGETSVRVQGAAAEHRSGASSHRALEHAVGALRSVPAPESLLEERIGYLTKVDARKIRMET